MASDDWRARINDAANAAKESADAATDLDQVTAQATALKQAFDDLMLTDKETYDKLVEIIKDATNRNEAMASVVDRLKSLGEVGKTLADTIGSLARGGSIGALRSALNDSDQPL